MATEVQARRLCRHFRAKKMYTVGGNPSHQTLTTDSIAHCWCLHTIREFGPDNKLVDLEYCCPGRGCFEPLIGDEAAG